MFGAFHFQIFGAFHSSKFGSFHSQKFGAFHSWSQLQLKWIKNPSDILAEMWEIFWDCSCWAATTPRRICVSQGAMNMESSLYFIFLPLPIKTRSGAGTNLHCLPGWFKIPLNWPDPSFWLRDLSSQPCVAQENGIYQAWVWSFGHPEDEAQSPSFSSPETISSSSGIYKIFPFFFFQFFLDTVSISPSAAAQMD